jgi:hypothetical protein
MVDESGELTRSFVGRFCALWIRELLDRHVRGYEKRPFLLEVEEELDFFCAWN